MGGEHISMAWPLPSCLGTGWISKSRDVGPVTEILQKAGAGYVSSDTGLPGAAVPTLHSRGHRGHMWEASNKLEG